MATGDGFTDGQISDPVAIGDFGMYHQTASTTSSFTVEVEFGCKLYTEHWVKYRAKVTANGSSYYSQEGIGLDPRVDTREGIPFTFKTNVTGLPSGRTFIYTVRIQWYDLELSSDTWHDGGEPHKKIGSTDGIPLPFNWQTANYSRYHPELDSDAGYGLTGEYYTGIDGGRYSALSRFNASAAQTQKAYNAIKNGGRTSDFNTRVWNDLMDHIAWVQNEWGISENKAINRVWPAPYISDLDPPYKKDIAIGDLVVKTDAGAAGRTITASVFNIATEAIPIVNTWPWEKELGRKKIMPNDICKGSYFLALVDTLNHWISLTPLSIIITSNIANQSMSGKMTQLPSVPVDLSGAFGLAYQFTPDNVQSIQGAHTARIGKLVDTFEVTVENGVLPFASQFNFWDFDSSCKAASVTAYVIGEFNGSIKQPTQVIDIGFASTLTIQSSGQIAAPKHTVDLTAPPGCVIGEHGYTLHTQSAFRIGTAPAFYLEHDGIFGIVNEFTITPKDNDQSVLEGTIGFSDTINGMITEPGIVMEYSKQLSMSDSFTASTSTGNVMSQDTQIRLVGTTDIISSTIIPLELDGSVSMSATVDDMREGRIFEIVDGSASVAIKPTSEVGTTKPIKIESAEILITEGSTGEIIYRPFAAMPTGSAVVTNSTNADVDAINMAHARAVTAEAIMISGGKAELTTSKGQKEIEIAHVELINTEAYMEFTAPVLLDATEVVEFNHIGELNKSSGYALENESAPILVHSEASITLGTVSLILASELEDTLVSELEDELAYDTERIVRLVEGNKNSNTK